MTYSQQVLEAVSEYYGINKVVITGRSREANVIRARRMVCLFLKDFRNTEIGKILKRSSNNTRYHKLIIIDELESSESVKRDYNAIRQLLDNEMTIKLNNSQLKELALLLSKYLEQASENIADELINLHLDDIYEKIRKRAKSGKDNLGLDDKQAIAIVLWYKAIPPFNQTSNYGYLSLLDIIQQLKPIYEQRKTAIGD